MKNLQATGGGGGDSLELGGFVLEGLTFGFRGLGEAHKDLVSGGGGGGVADLFDSEGFGRVWGGGGGGGGGLLLLLLVAQVFLCLVDVHTWCECI